jgi:allantoin racemase
MPTVKVLVIAPFLLDEEGVADRDAQQQEIALGPDIQFHYEPVKAGPAWLDSQHDWMLKGPREPRSRSSGAGARLRRGLHRHDERLWGQGAPVAPGHPGDRTGEKLQPYGAYAGQQLLCPDGVGPVDPDVLARRTGTRPPEPRRLAPFRQAGAQSAQPAWRLRGRIVPGAVPRGTAVDDGADVIGLGSTTTHGAHRYLSDRLPVPVINPGPLTYKLAKMLGVPWKVLRPRSERKRSTFEEPASQYLYPHS